MASGGDSFWYGKISRSVNNKPGTEEFYIYTPDNSWNASWITIEQIDGSDWCWIDNEKDEGQYVTYIISWDQNYSSARTATFVVTYNNGEMPQGTIEIRQAAGITYTQSVSPSSRSVGVGGGNASFTLSSNRPSGNWKASKNSSLTWLTPTIESAGAQNTTLTVRVDGQYYAATEQPYFTSMGAVSGVGAGGGSVTSYASGFNGKAGTGVSARQGGIAVSKGGNSAGSVIIYQDGYTPAALNSAALTGARTTLGSVTYGGNVNGGWVTVSVGSNVGTQTTQPSQPSFSSLNSGNTLYVGAGGGGQTVYASGYNGAAGKSGTSTSARSGTVYVSGAGVTRTFSVYQAGWSADALQSLNSAALTNAGDNVGWITNVNRYGNVNGGYVTFNVASNVGTQTTQHTQPYLTSMSSVSNIPVSGGCVTSYASGYNGGGGKSGTSTSARSGTVWAYGAGVTRAFTVYQYGWNPDALAGLGSAALTGASSNASWLKVNSYSGNVNGGYVYVCADSQSYYATTQPSQPYLTSMGGVGVVSVNGGSVTSYASGYNGAAGSMGKTALSRTATVTVTGAGYSKTFTVTQNGYTPDALVGLGSAALTGASSNASWATIATRTGNVHGGYVTVNVAGQSYRATTASTQPSFSSLSSVSAAAAGGGYTSTASGNNGTSGTYGQAASGRTATITVTGAGYSKSFYVGQYGYSPSAVTALNSAAISASGTTTRWISGVKHSGNVNGGKVGYNVAPNTGTQATQPSWSRMSNVAIAVGGGSGTSTSSGTVGGAGSSTSARTGYVWAYGAGVTRVATITQSGWSPDAYTYPSLTGASEGVSWLTIISYNGTVAGGTIGVTASSNVGTQTTQPTWSSMSSGSVAVGGGGYTSTSSGSNGSDGSSTSGRTAAVTVTASGLGSKTFYVSQPGWSKDTLKSAALNGASSNQSWAKVVNYSGTVNGGKVGITVLSNVGTERTNPTWSGMSNVTIGAGGGSGTSTSSGNNGNRGSGTNARTATITVAAIGTAKTFTVSQPGWSPQAYTEPNITGASSNATWITGITYSGGVSGGTVKFNVAPQIISTQGASPVWGTINDVSVNENGGSITSTITGGVVGSLGKTAAARSATITVNAINTTKTIIVNQDALTPDDYSTPTITGASENVDWITNVGYTGTAAEGKVTFTVASNVGTQAVQPTFTSFPTVTTWNYNDTTAKTSKITTTIGSKGVTKAARSTNITVSATGLSNKTFTVSQSGWKPNSYTTPSLVVTSSNDNFIVSTNSTSAENATITITPKNSNMGTQTVGATFSSLSKTNMSFAHGGGSFTSTASVNAGYEGTPTQDRTSTITAIWGGTTKTITATQKGFTPNAYTAPSYSVSDNADWITTSRSGNTITVNASSNTAIPTTASITLSSNSSTCISAGATGSFTVTTSGYNKTNPARSGKVTVSYGGVTKEITVNQDGHSVSTTLNVTSDSSWLKPTLSGNTVSWVAETNTGYTPRNGIITASYGGKTANYIVVQEGVAPTYTYIEIEGTEIEGPNGETLFKLTTRSDFNTLKSGHFTTELNKLITYGELKNIESWTSTDENGNSYIHELLIENANNYTDNQCIVCSDIVRKNYLIGRA